MAQFLVSLRKEDVTFDYKGFDISVSNFGICQAPVLVFTRYNKELPTEKPLHTVEDAIRLVDNLLLENPQDFE